MGGSPNQISSDLPSRTTLIRTEPKEKVDIAVPKEGLIIHYEK